VYRDQGRYAESEAAHSRALDSFRRGLGEAHPSTVTTIKFLGRLYRSKGEYAEAEAAFQKASDMRRRRLGEEHPDVMEILIDLAELYRLQGKYAEAESLATRALATLRRVLAEEHRSITDALVMTGEIRLAQQHYREAEPPLREALRRYENTNPNHWRRFHIQSMLGAGLAGQKRCAEAEPLLLSGYRVLQEQRTMIPADSRRIVELSFRNLNANIGCSAQIGREP
jgi:eukaryotic-like serine/threonine-protein kinase